MRIKKLETDADNDNGIPTEMRTKLRIALNTGDDLRRQLVTAQEDLRALRHQLSVVLANDANDDTGTVHGGHLDEDVEKSFWMKTAIEAGHVKSSTGGEATRSAARGSAAEKEKVELHLQAIKAGGRRRQAQRIPFSPCKRCEELKEEAARLRRLNDDLQEQLEQYTDGRKGKGRTVAAALNRWGAIPRAMTLLPRCREFSEAELSRLKRFNRKSRRTRSGNDCACD